MLSTPVVAAFALGCLVTTWACIAAAWHGEAAERSHRIRRASQRSRLIDRKVVP